MRVLVTGHRGYIGVEMVPVLRAAGHEVVGLDIGLYDGCDFGGPPDEVESLDVDLRDVLPEHLEGFDAVAHLAALSNDPLGDLNSDLTKCPGNEPSGRLRDRMRRPRPSVARSAGAAESAQPSVTPMSLSSRAASVPIAESDAL